MEKIALSDIRDESVRSHFADLMESVKPSRVLLVIYLCATLGGLFSFVALLVIHHLVKTYDYDFNRNLQSSIGLTVNLCLLGSLANYYYLTHMEIHRIKINGDYERKLKVWLAMNNHNMQELAENLFEVAPKRRSATPDSILFTIQDESAIVLMSSRSMKKFFKVFE